MKTQIENQMKDMAAQNPARRKFLKDSAALMGGLVIGFYLPMKGGRAYAADAPPKPVYPPNAFIRIAPDDSITIVVNKSEMGQGVYTSLPMLIAEELEADWSRISVESAPVAAVYNHTAFAMQMTGGSSSIPSSWEQLRRVGASGRMMLIRAAAQQWGVPESECHAANSQVIHAERQEASYGALADAADKLPLPDNVALKSPKDFKIIGKPTKRLDTPAKINGSAQFGLDVYLPGMLTVLIARSPVFGGKVKSFDATEARKVAGVQGVYQVPTGIAVAASGFWPAKTARDLLEIEWDEGPGAALSTPEDVCGISRAGEDSRVRWRARMAIPTRVSRMRTRPSAPNMRCLIWRTPRWSRSTWWWTSSPITARSGPARRCRPWTARWRRRPPG